MAPYYDAWFSFSSCVGPGEKGRPGKIHTIMQHKCKIHGMIGFRVEDHNILTFDPLKVHVSRAEVWAANQDETQAWKHFQICASSKHVYTCSISYFYWVCSLQPLVASLKTLHPSCALNLVHLRSLWTFHSFITGQVLPINLEEKKVE